MLKPEKRYEMKKERGKQQVGGVHYKTGVELFMVFKNIKLLYNLKWKR